ncbi:hypothetical protein VMCG_05304 [Cytospora schulzeri]|uniref:HTH CENPB-type domain-containing protein n=1 Tax=Cytospora schulzeri TaxID=448051 RepID=A0A423WQH9_9PEZI|nr:hypothetical protein VMCG_05304 [Valsa malicola]
MAAPTATATASSSSVANGSNIDNTSSSSSFTNNPLNNNHNNNNNTNTNANTTSATTTTNNNNNSSNTNSPQQSQKERHSLSLDQRRALRRWANSQTVRPSHKACIEWFTSQYGTSISQSTVSHSLSPKYARLDGDPQLSGSRLRFGNWPDVEKLVLMWHHSMVNSGRQPTNEELADKAKSIFHQLPRYKDEPPPEFSPGWIHRFKKRYGLLIRRQRRHHHHGGPGGGTGAPPKDDIPYLVDTVPRFMSVGPDTSPAAIREAVNRIVGVEPSLATCARVRDEVVRRLDSPHLGHPNGHHPSHAGGPDDDDEDDDDMGANNHAHVHAHAHGHPPASAAAAATAPGDAYGDEEQDPELILQNALHALQQEEADAEAEAAAIREERERSERGALAASSSLGGLAGGASQSYAQQAAGAALATPVRNGVGQQQQQQQQPGSGGGGANTNGVMSSSSSSSQHQHQQHQQQQHQPRYSVGEDLNLTPIPANGPISSTDRPMRCPFCINQRMLRTIKEAVEHMSTHVVV